LVLGEAQDAVIDIEDLQVHAPTPSWPSIRSAPEPGALGLIVPLSVIT